MVFYPSGPWCLVGGKGVLTLCCLQTDHGVGENWNSASALLLCMPLPWASRQQLNPASSPSGVLCPSFDFKVSTYKHLKTGWCGYCTAKLFIKSVPHCRVVHYLLHCLSLCLWKILHHRSIALADTPLPQGTLAFLLGKISSSWSWRALGYDALLHHIVPFPQDIFIKLSELSIACSQILFLHL